MEPEPAYEGLTDRARRKLALAQAYAECALHLEYDWTDNPLEREEGLKLAERLDREADRLTWMALRRRRTPVGPAPDLLGEV